MLLKNVAGQGIYLQAWDTTQSPVIGKASDQANITGFYSLDGAAEVTGFTTANPTNIGGGAYWQPLSQAESNANRGALRWVSATSGIIIDPVFFETSGVNLPAIAFNTSGGIITFGTSTGQLNVSSGNVALIATALSLIKDSSGTYDIRQLITMLFEAAPFAKLSGLPGGPAVLRNFADTQDRATITFNSDNNRTTIVINNAP